MDLRTYQQKAIRTNKWLGDSPLLKDYEAAKATISIYEAPKVACNWDSAHMVIGMFSELNEIQAAILSKDKINLDEEVADVMWYASNEATIHQVPICAQLDVSVFYFESLVQATSEYADFAKKGIIYNAERTFTQRIDLLQKIVTICYNFHSYTGEFAGKINLPNALERNIAKLEKRFPHKYSDEKAQNRDLAAERRILENNN